MTGSSPLARGLPAPTTRLAARSGIIPARAGFTAEEEHPVRATRDHPRSRGVYTTPPPRPRGGAGSSPLARGLREGVHWVVDYLGIIPARAGFTSCARSPAVGESDHPRSRGVYTTQGVRNMGEGGIIPARAGFTRRRRRILAGRPDHPRSRGVYRMRWPPRPDTRGSSPLARGLPATPAADIPLGRIIPARAGFTGRGRFPRRRSADHPRSRGVYSAACMASAEAGGSSPLARGLRGEASPLVLGLGIIPARAGFTGATGDRGAVVTDHPRSRGVYTISSVTRTSTKGSSPLARGLLAGPGECAFRIGIIPARAGFTSGREGKDVPTEDHPRSRGVYRPGAGGRPWG